MKKSIIIIAAFIAITCQSFAEDCTFNIINHTNIDITGEIGKCNTGSFMKLFVGDDPAAILNIKAGFSSTIKTPSSDVFCGVDGSLTFNGGFEHKTYGFSINFNVPYIGDNDYSWNAYAYENKGGSDLLPTPFLIKQIGDGQGSHPTITFEIVGKILPTPPPPPIAITNIGNRTIAGSFVWNGDTDGMPDAGVADWVNNTFKLDVECPSRLIRDLDNTGPNSYNGSNGTFSGAQKVGKIIFMLSVPDATNKQTINYRITNLPEGVPIHIGCISNIKWIAGKNSKPNPGNAFRFMVFIDEQNKTNNTINYKVTGGWVFDDGGKAGGATSDVQALIAKLKGLIYSHNEDATMGKSFIHADNSTSVKAIGNLNLQINQTPNASQNALDKSKLGNKAVIH